MLDQMFNICGNRVRGTALHTPVVSAKNECILFVYIAFMDSLDPLGLDMVWSEVEGRLHHWSVKADAEVFKLPPRCHNPCCEPTSGSFISKSSSFWLASHPDSSPEENKGRVCVRGYFWLLAVCKTEGKAWSTLSCEWHQWLTYVGRQRK